MSETEQLTLDRLYEVVSYDPERGLFTWIVDRKNRKCAGSIAGSKPNSDGYSQIKIDGVLHKAHRLAWFYMTGSQPDREIDHRDGDRMNNRWSNLRLADDRENARNRAIRADNTSGVPGVNWMEDRGKWRVRVVNEKRQRIVVGDFERLEDAVAARSAAAKKHYGEFAGELRSR